MRLTRADPILIAREPGAHVVEKSPIDLLDDFAMAWQRCSNQVSGHFSSASGSSV